MDSASKREIKRKGNISSNCGVRRADSRSPHRDRSGLSCSAWMTAPHGVVGAAHQAVVFTMIVVPMIASSNAMVGKSIQNGWGGYDSYIKSRYLRPSVSRTRLATVVSASQCGLLVKAIRPGVWRLGGCWQPHNSHLRWLFAGRWGLLKYAATVSRQRYSSVEDRRPCGDGCRDVYNLRHRQIRGACR